MSVPASSAHDSRSDRFDDAQAMDLIRRKGGRATGSRRVILEGLAGAAGPITAEQLSENAGARYPEIHLSTVYRTLERLESLGIAHHTHLGHGPAQWQLTRRACGYLVCRHCGNVTEADSALFANLRRKIRQQLGFEIGLQHFAITGTCRTCLQETGSSSV